jgi:hypothetical protein
LRFVPGFDIASVTLVVVVLTLLVYAGQFIEMRRLRASQNLFQAIDALQKQDVRAARQELIKLHGVPLDTWGDEKKFLASTAIAAYDVVAIHIRTGAVSADPIEQD